MRLRPLLLAAALLLPVFPAFAAPLEYRLDFPPGNKVHFRVPVRVELPGRTVVTVEWTGPDMLSFRVQGPGPAIPELRRTGASPQKIEFDVADGQTGEWAVVIRGLPARVAGTGSIRIEPPETIVPDVDVPESIVRPAEIPVEPWLAVRPALPAHAPAAARRLAEARETFRTNVTVDDAPPDVCRWQHDFLRFVTDRLDAVQGGEPAVDVHTGDLLTRMAAAVGRVDELRKTRDADLFSPQPSSIAERNAWRRVRDSKLRPYRRVLDSITEALDRGYAPMLGREPWSRRFIGCLTSCERHFEERTQVGDEAAPHGRLARDQWERIVEAAELFNALAAARD